MTHLFDKLLLATEHSEHDLGSERIALAMAQRCAVPLAVVLPILSNPEYEAVAPQLAMQTEAQAAALLDQVNALADAAGVRCEVEARRGAVLFQEITDEARRLASELIVIRRRGRPGLLANLLVGEMVSQVLAHAPCSVLVVPRMAQMWTRHVMVAIDPHAPDAAALHQGAEVAAICGLPLTLVAVVERGADDEAQRTLAGALATVRSRVPQAQTLCLHGKAHQQLLAAAQRLQADLLVVGRRGEGGFARAWIGGAAQKVIGLADCAVLVAVETRPTKSPVALPV